MAKSEKMTITDKSYSSGGGYNRDLSVDILRAICIFLIILAHVNPPGILLAVRTFDVTCMVFISGISFAYSSKKITCFKDYLLYIWKRIKRLLFPTWICLTIYFVVFFLLSQALGFEYYSVKTIINSYALYSGIGYVWIIRIYLCMAIIAPILRMIYDAVISNVKWFNIPLIVLVTVIYYFICLFLKGKVSFVDTAIIPVFGYGIVYYIGISFKEMLYKEKFILLGVCIIWFILLGIIDGFQTPQNCKYPPEMYYLSYGLIWSIVLSLLFGLVKQVKCKLRQIIVFLSKQSMNIYLVHIFVIGLFIAMGWSVNWVLEYMVVVAFSLVVVLSVYYGKSIINRKYDKKF